MKKGFRVAQRSTKRHACMDGGAGARVAGAGGRTDESLDPRSQRHDPALDKLHKHVGFDAVQLGNKRLALLRVGDALEGLLVLVVLVGWR